MGLYLPSIPQVMAVEPLNGGDDDLSHLPQEFHFNDPDSFDFVGELRWWQITSAAGDEAQHFGRGLYIVKSNHFNA